VQQVGCEPQQVLLVRQPAPGLFPNRLVLLLRYRLRRVACRVRAAAPVPESYGHFFNPPVVGSFTALPLKPFAFVAEKFGVPLWNNSRLLMLQRHCRWQNERLGELFW
jgi:hypothetical protein